MKVPRISQDIIFMLISDKEGVFNFKLTSYCQVTWHPRGGLAPDAAGILFCQCAT